MKSIYNKGIVIDNLILPIILMIALINSVFLSVDLFVLGVLFSILFMLFKLFFSDNYTGNINLFIVPFGIYILIHILFSNINMYGKIIDFTVYVLFILIQLITIKQKQVLIKTFKVILFVGITNFFFVLYQYFLPEKYQEWILNRFAIWEQAYVIDLISYNFFFGITIQPAHLAGIFVLCIAICVFSDKVIIKNKYFNLFLVSFFIIGLISAAKRAHIVFGITSIVIVLIIFYLLNMHKKYTKKIYLIIVFTIIISIVLSFMVLKFYSKVMIFREIIETFTGMFQGVDVSNGRGALYKVTVDYFYESPIIGNGWKFISDITRDGVFGHAFHPHNIYLQLLSELGIIGFILFMGLVIWNLLNSFKIYQIIKNTKLISLLYICIFYQIFFLLYGFTGNLITDYNYLLMYSFFVLVSNSLSKVFNLSEKGI